MKEDLIIAGTSFAKDTIKDFKNDVKERIKLPLLISYSIILVVYNWDVLYYLIFKVQESYDKIEFIKEKFPNPDYERFTTPFLWAIATTFLFPAVQVIINQLFKYFEKLESVRTNSKELDKANLDKEILDVRSGNKDRKEMQGTIESNKALISTLESEKARNQSEINSLKKVIIENQKIINEFSFNQKVLGDLFLYTNEQHPNHNNSHVISKLYEFIILVTKERNIEKRSLLIDMLESSTQSIVNFAEQTNSLHLTPAILSMEFHILFEELEKMELIVVSESFNDLNFEATDLGKKVFEAFSKIKDDIL